MIRWPTARCGWSARAGGLLSRRNAASWRSRGERACERCSRFMRPGRPARRDLPSASGCGAARRRLARQLADDPGATRSRTVASCGSATGSAPWGCWSIMARAAALGAPGFAPRDGRRRRRGGGGLLHRARCAAAQPAGSAGHISRRRRAVVTALAGLTVAATGVTAAFSPAARRGWRCCRRSTGDEPPVSFRGVRRACATALHTRVRAGRRSPKARRCRARVGHCRACRITLVVLAAAKDYGRARRRTANLPAARRRRERSVTPATPWMDLRRRRADARPRFAGRGRDRADRIRRRRRGEFLERVEFACRRSRQRAGDAGASTATRRPTRHRRWFIVTVGPHTGSRSVEHAGDGLRPDARGRGRCAFQVEGELVAIGGTTSPRAAAGRSNGRLHQNPRTFRYKRSDARTWRGAKLIAAGLTKDPSGLDVPTSASSWRRTSYNSENRPGS